MTITQIDTRHLLPGICRTHPSIVKWNGRRIMSYRVERDPPNRLTRTGLCECDDRWSPIPKKTIELRAPIDSNSASDGVVEDCRLFVHGNNDLMFHMTNRDMMGVGHLNEYVEVTYFEWMPKAVKNWTPYQDGLETKWREWPTDGKTLPDWEYGEPRGGTPLIQYGQWQVGFFHSHVMAEKKPLPKHHPCDVAHDQPRRTYFGSPYAWSGNTVLLPTEPLIWPRLYGSDKRPHTNHDVVFPCGIVREGDNWTVSYGDDADAWLAHFTTEEIFNVLRPG